MTKNETNITFYYRSSTLLELINQQTIPSNCIYTLCYSIMNINTSTTASYEQCAHGAGVLPVLQPRGRWLSSHASITGKFTPLHWASAFTVRRACSTIGSAVPNSPWCVTYNSDTWNNSNNLSEYHNELCTSNESFTCTNQTLLFGKNSSGTFGPTSLVFKIMLKMLKIKPGTKNEDCTELCDRNLVNTSYQHTLLSKFVFIAWFLITWLSGNTFSAAEKHRTTNKELKKVEKE